MKKINFNVLSDTLFSFFSAWLVSVCALRLIKVPKIPAVLAGLFISLAFALTVFFILYSSSEKKRLKKREREEKERLMLHLSLSPDGEVLSLLKPITENTGTAVPRFTLKPVEAEAVAEIFKARRGKEITLFCDEISADGKKLCSDIGIKVVDGMKTYLLLKEKEALPKEYFPAKKGKKKLKEKLSACFSPSNANTFFRCGAGLLILSFFTLFPLYYIISGSLLVVASLVMRFFLRGNE